jgi:hypothetical protein
MNKSMRFSLKPAGGHGIILATAFVPRPDIKVYLLLFLPLLFLIVWFLAFQSKRYGAMLLWSILLVVFDIPHIMGIYFRLSDSHTFSLDIHYQTLFQGGCFSLNLLNL